MKYNNIYNIITNTLYMDKVKSLDKLSFDKDSNNITSTYRPISIRNSMINTINNPVYNYTPELLINFTNSNCHDLYLNYMIDNKLKLNGGFYKFKSGSLKSIWDDFSLNPHFWQLHYYNTGVVHHKYYGEQNYVNWKVQQNNIK